jgi:hypothetical protein
MPPKLTFLVVVLALGLASLHAQNGVTCIDKITTSNNCYRLTKAENPPRGMVVLLPYYGADANEFNSARLPQLLAKQGITTVVVSAAGYLFDDDLESLYGLIAEVAKANQIPPGKMIIGGISAGGTGAARFVERCQMQDCGPLKPVAWFSVDAPLDFERWWNSQTLNLQRGDPKSHLEESQAILDVLKMSMGGSPKDARDAYIKKSPFLALEKGGGNARLLANVPVRLYTEPDVQWTIENWRTDYYNLNAVDQAALTLQLLELGNSQAELITTTGKGYRPAGVRNPHSWTIVDEDDLARWIARQL